VRLPDLAVEGDLTYDLSRTSAHLADDEAVVGAVGWPRSNSHDPPPGSRVARERGTSRDCLVTSPTSSCRLSGERRPDGRRSVRTRFERQVPTVQVVRHLVRIVAGDYGVRFAAVWDSSCGRRGLQGDAVSRGRGRGRWRRPTRTAGARQGCEGNHDCNRHGEHDHSRKARASRLCWKVCGQRLDFGAGVCSVCAIDPCGEFVVGQRADRISARQPLRSRVTILIGRQSLSGGRHLPVNE
jgi:hypothetical protein